MKNPSKTTDRNNSRKKADPQSDKSHALIAAKLRGYYDSIVDEGTPDHFLDLLERLDAAEQESMKK
ncbi:MAG: NepR family anti-sigma factor [Allorhizobium sp.]